MRIERKRPGKTLPVRLAEGEIFAREFDGYHLVLHCRDKEGRELRVILESHETTRTLEHVRVELERQRARVDSAVKVADEVLG